MGIAVGLGLYLMLAAIFYVRLTATATDGMHLSAPKPSHWHRARYQAKELVRRVRAARKH